MAFCHCRPNRNRDLFGPYIPTGLQQHNVIRRNYRDMGSVGHSHDPVALRRLVCLLKKSRHRPTKLAVAQKILLDSNSVNCHSDNRLLLLCQMGNGVELRKIGLF